MRRLSKALLEQEQTDASVAICRAMANSDELTENQIRLLTFYFARLEQILAYIDEKTDSIPPLI